MRNLVRGYFFYGEYYIMEMWQLKQRQSLPLDAKINLSKQKIIEWYEKNNGDVYVSFSGGKDSTVMLHLVRSIHKHIPAVFVDTGLEYPEVKAFAKEVDNVITLKPSMNFKNVLETYGYPVVNKMQSQYIEQYRNGSEKMKKLRWEGKVYNGVRNYKISEKWKFLVNAPFKISDKCCQIMKKDPIKKYNKESKRKAFVGIMACDSSQRQKQYLQNGCNSFKLGVSKPLAFWVESDIWDYIKKYNLKYAKIYDYGMERTGCMFCMFGCQFEKKGSTRFDILKKHHVKLYNYCMDKLKLQEVINFVNKQEEQ